MKKFITLLVCTLLFWQIAHAQSKKVTGKVYDEKNNPVTGATVAAKGKASATITNGVGEFEFNVPLSVKTLVISSVNYTTQEVDITSNSSPIVSLKPSTKNLEEVVVVAYGTQSRTNVTGSISSVKAADLENKPFTSIDKTLQGYVTGLQSSSSSGAPGSGTDIRIRGIGSTTAAGSSPLWVIDGVIATTGDLSSNTTTTNALSTINPDDIENISVLKDAATASLYGSRAANGVIIVTTKKGKVGKTRISFAAEAGQSDIAFKPKNRPVTTSEYQTLLRESLINAGYATTNAGADSLIVDPNNGLGLNPNYTQTNTDWLKEVTQKGRQQQYNLTMSGGDAQTQFYASGGYFQQEGLTLATTFKRYNGSFSLTHRLNDKMTFATGINGGASNQRTPSNGGYFSNPASAPFFLPPYYSPRNADGSLKYDDDEGQFSIAGGFFNPLVIAEYDKATTQQTTFRGYVSGEYQLLSFLKFTSKYSGEYITLQEDSYRNPFYGDGQAQGGDAFSAYRRVYDWTWANYFDVKKNINKQEDIYFDFKLGYEAQAYKSYILQAGGQGFPKTLDLQTLASAATPTTAFTLPAENTTRSIFSTGDINYKDRYVISASFRRDGASKFGVNKKNANFYSVGASWNLSEEAFFKKIALINTLKIRGSYGVNGNQAPLGNYQSLPTYGYGQNYNGLPGSALSNVGNDNLTWEKNKIFNVGLDFSILKNRVFGTFEIYNRKTTDLLLNVPLSLTSGVSGQFRNVGAMTNKGYEITLGGRPVVTKNFSWTITANISHNTNRITALYLNNPVADPDGGLFNFTVGHDIYEFYTRQWAGVNPDNGDPQWYTDDTHSAVTSTLSQVKLSLSGKSADPKYFGSVLNTFTFKGFSLDAQFYYNFGNYIYQGYSTYLNSDGFYYASFGQLSEQLDSWKKPGDVTNTPKIIFGGNQNSHRTSTRFLYKGDYIRLRNIQLGYNIPAAALKKIHLISASVYVRATDFVTFGTDKRLPVDPETGSASTGNFEVYIPKTITAGIKIGLN